MKRLLLPLFFCFAQPVFADVLCTVEAGWGLQFNSGMAPAYYEAYQILKNGSKSEADVEIQQVYSSPIEFRARILFDGQNTHIRADLSSRDGEYAVYTGTIQIEKKLTLLVCKQN